MYVRTLETLCIESVCIERFDNLHCLRMNQSDTSAWQATASQPFKCYCAQMRRTLLFYSV